MKTFIIDSENQVAAYQSSAATANVKQGGSTFRDAGELEALAETWSGARLVSIWNNLPGVARVTKFTNRSVGVRRIWQAIQNLTPVSPPIEVPVDEAKRAVARENSKKARVLEMLARPQGTTVKEIMVATGWQAHTVRGFLSGTVTKRLGLPLVSERPQEGERVYRLGSRDGE